ncbi:MAG: LysM peptidoglycan-binding domain-containing protein [Rhodothermales bacterium]
MSEVEADVDVLNDDRSVARRLEDAALATRVRLALLESRTLRPYEFEPVATNGRIQLRGTVQTQNQSQEAQSIAEAVAGVSAVVNEISTSAESAPVAVAREEADTPPEKKEPVVETRAETMSEESEKDAAPQPVYREGELRPGIRGLFLSEVKPPAPSETPETDEAAEQGQVHTVRSGDSLWEIARRYNVTVEEIRRLNGMRSNSIRPGQRLKIK